MRYIMKQQLFSWGDDFIIKDETGRDVFSVGAQGFSFGKQLSFQDLNGNELAFIKQELFSLGPTFEIYIGDQPHAVVSKELFTFFSCKFTVDVPGPDDLEAEGNFLEHEYVFTREGNPVAAVIEAVVLMVRHVWRGSTRGRERYTHTCKYSSDRYGLSHQSELTNGIQIDPTARL